MSSFFGGGPKSPLQKQQDMINIPSVSQSEPIPYLFGTQYMAGIVVYPSEPSHMIAVKKSTGSSGKAGFGGGAGTGSNIWFLNWLTIYSCNPVLRIYRVKIDQHHIWPADDNSIGVGNTAYLDGHPFSMVNLNPTVQGTMNFYFGTANDAPDPFLFANASNAPSWPGFSKMFFEMFQVGTSPSVPNVKVLATGQLTSPLADGHLYITPATGLYQEANLVHVIADLLTNPRYGAEIPIAQLDCGDPTCSWEQAAATLAAEGIAGSGYLDRAEKASSLVQSLLDHVGGVVFRSAGVYKLKLIRRDYSLAQVPVIAENHLADLTLKPSVPTRQVNQLWVEFSDQTREYSSSPVLVPNVAHATSVGPVNPQKLDRKYFTCQQVAFAAAQTNAPYIVSPPDKITFKLNRCAALTLNTSNGTDYGAFECGDVICPVWSRGNPPLDGSRVFRITSVKRPLNGPYLEAEAFEEFATVQAGIPPVVTVQNQPTTGGGTGGISLPITTRFPLELPWDMAVGRTMQITDLCARTQQIYTAFQLYGGTLPDIFDVFTSHGLVCIGGVLGNYPAATLAIDDVVGFTITPNVDSSGAVDATAADLLNYWVTASVTRPELFSRARYAVLANPTTGAHEIVAWQTITQIGSAYQVTGVIRGLFDTEPQDFNGANSVFLFSTIPFTVDRRGDWANGVTINLKAVPYNDSDAGSPTAAATQTLALTERAARAFPVTNPRVNGLGPIFNPRYTAGAPVQITWLPRTRGAGCGYNNPQGIFDPSIATEGDFLVRIVVAGVVTRTFTIAPTATVNLGDGVPRLVCNYDASLDGNPVSFTAQISARVNGWESLRSTNITVVKQ